MTDPSITRMWHAFHGDKHKPCRTSIMPVCDAKNSCERTPRMLHTWRNILPGLVPTVHAAEAMASPLPLTSTDKMKVPPKVVLSDIEVQEYLANETGRDRLRQMFSNDLKGNPSPELNIVITCTKQTLFLSSFFAAILGSRVAREDFIRKNKHTKYQNRYRALRAQQDAVLIGGLKSGAKWGFKTGIFSCIFLMTSQCITVYRNKSSLLEYTAGGMVTGSILRMNLGLRGMFAGGIIGAGFGSIGGLAIYGLLRMSNQLQEQRHYWMIQERLKEKKSFQSPGSTIVTEEELKDVATVETPAEAAPSSKG